jgi:hypothetical protein
MAVDVVITLNILQCINQDRGSDGSQPYLWPAFVTINTATAKVNVVGGWAPSLARVVLSDGMHSGDTVSIPSTIGNLGGRFDDDVSQYKVIMTLVLWEKRDLSDDSILAGFNVFSDALESAIENNLGGLASPDPTVNQTAIDAVKNSVHDQVYNAIENSLTDPEKLEVKLGLLVPDSVIDSSSTVLSTMSDQSFQVSLGDGQSNSYVIDATLQLKPVLCEAEQYAVNQDTVVVNQLKAELAEMKKEFAQAPPSEKPGILEDIKEFTKNELNPTEAKLAQDTKALNACRTASGVGR